MTAIQARALGSLSMEEKSASLLRCLCNRSVLGLRETRIQPMMTPMDLHRFRIFQLDSSLSSSYKSQRIGIKGLWTLENVTKPHHCCIVAIPTYVAPRFLLHQVHIISNKIRETFIRRASFQKHEKIITQHLVSLTWLQSFKCFSAWNIDGIGYSKFFQLKSPGKIFGIAK